MNHCSISVLLIIALLTSCSSVENNQPKVLSGKTNLESTSPDNLSQGVSVSIDIGDTGLSQEDVNTPANGEKITEAIGEDQIESGPTPTPLPASWKDYPVIPNISPAALAIYQKGIKMGNDPNSFSKIGDCQNITTYFLASLENPKLYSLGDEYGYLQDTIDYFYGSFSRESLAVAGGLNVARVLSPFHSDIELCEPNEHPLACEVRVNNPSIAIVSLEENWSSRTAEEYEGYLRRVIEYLISEGVLPILATKADNLEGDHRINKTVVSLAEEYQLPMWNFWKAVQPLPNHGLEEDGFHLTVAGPYFDSKGHMRSAWPWRNLTALQSLHAVLEAVEDN